MLVAPTSVAATLDGSGALRSAENRRRGTLGRTDRRQLPRAARTVLVVAAYEMDVKGLVKAVSGAAPELGRAWAEFLAETTFLMLPMPWAVSPACSAALRPPSLLLCVQCALSPAISMGPPFGVFCHEHGFWREFCGVVTVGDR
jgi:hypothetical protein